MKLNYFIPLVSLMILLSFGAYSQRNCHTMGHLENLIQEDPATTHRMANVEAHTRQIIDSGMRDNLGTITIPVVVHVIYNTTTQNISDAQIQSQIDVLNQDFRRTNSDADNTWSQAADSNIEFCMATVDPNGNPTTGITRTATNVSSFSTNDAMKYSSQGGKDAWPSDKYLNMWVCNIGGGILGYAQFPGSGSAATDGVVMGYNYFGTIGAAQAPFDKGRTTTHEVGHWLNLRHIWGDGNCSQDDFVSDTPSSDAPNYGCSVGHVSCNSTDMVQNYMDYSDDACMNLFTFGQRDRMRALFAAGGARASLLNSSACGDSNPPPPSTCNYNEVTVSVTLDNYGSETTWTLTNSSNQVIASGGPYTNNTAGSTKTSVLCLDDGCYNFNINDAYGDGICCGYGNGAYSVTDASGNILASGGQFTSSDSKNFCLNSAPAPTCNDGIQNGNETGVDCGGDCSPCVSCNDGIQNGNETGIDCGGSCQACPTCNDGIQNQGEAGIDCGGPCTACTSCNDGIQNQGETGVDCGGPCAACNTGGGCSDNDIIVSITLDNYGSETTWTLLNASGSAIASGGPYSDNASGTVITESVCAADGCYDFVINDAYGDGICCGYGNGSYQVISASSGQTIISGSSFGTSETQNFCLGNTSPQPTCNDGIQNGDETGVDCGGSSCTPCNTGGGCSYVTITSDDFENGYGNWNDGGSDCVISSQNSAYAYSGTYCVLLRDNTSTSVVTTDNLNLSSFSEVKVAFTYYARSMDNSNEDFWLQVSTNGGSSYQTVEEWNQGDEFQNDQRKFEEVVLTGTFTSNTRFRFRCDASTNSDYVYIDDVVISGCTSNARQTNTESLVSNAAEDVSEVITDVKVFPNPTSEDATITFETHLSANVQMSVFDLKGSHKMLGNNYEFTQGIQRITIPSDQLASGIYMIRITTGDQVITKKLVVAKK